VALTLFAYKLLYPDGLFLTRGNHESRTCNAMYGFEGEVLHKYDRQVMSLFTEVFNQLPLAACINEKVNKRAQRAGQHPSDTRLKQKKRGGVC
jgi:serine/threonine-protein phosphatase 5